MQAVDFQYLSNVCVAVAMDAHHPLACTSSAPQKSVSLLTASKAHFAMGFFQEPYDQPKTKNKLDQRITREIQDKVYFLKGV